ERALERAVAARRVGANHDAGDPGELAPQVHRNLIAGALALILPRQQDLDLPAADAAATRPEARPARARADHHRRGLGHQLADRLLEPEEDRLDHLEAGALRELDVHVDLPLVRLRRQ